MAASWQIGLSIRAKVMAFVALIIVICIFALTLSHTASNNRILFKEFKLRTQSISQAAAGNLELPLLTNNHDELHKLRQTLLQIPDVIEVIITAKSDTRPVSQLPQTKDVFPVEIPIYTETTPFLDSDTPDANGETREYLGTLFMLFSTEKFVQHQNEMYRDSIIIACITLLISLILAYYLINTVTNPLLRLVQITQRAAKGDLNQQMPTESDDEIGILAKSFNSMMASLHERTEDLKLVNRKLVRSNEDLDKFAHVVSHDLGAPLRRINDFIRMLKRETDPLENERIDTLTSRISNSADHGIQLMNSLLELSRVNTRSKPFTQVDLNKVLEEVQHDMEHALQQSQSQLHIAELPTIEADAMQLYQLFQNLIGNAIKYRKPDVPPQISIGCIVDHRNAHIRVCDNGIGFENKHAKQIFQVFTRLHKNQEQYDGHGVGLSICDRIVKRLGGEISADSTPGKGTCFHIEIPLQQALRVEEAPHE